MITYVVCDLFESPAHVLVNTVNTVGVMGKGIAREFKRIYPEMFGQYQQICEKGSFNIGNLWLYKTSNKWVLNFPTKRHWRQPSRPEYIEAGLKKFVKTYHVHGITSASFPMLGCGNGELDWETQVQPLMEQYLGDVPIRVFIHLQDRTDPFGPEHRNVKLMRDWLRGEPGSLPFDEVWEDLCSMVTSCEEFDSLDSGHPFRVQVEETGNGLMIDSAGEAVDIPAEAFKELWQQIRTAGFVSRDHLPYGLGATSACVMSIMGRLPYVVPVVMTNKYGDLSSQPIGLRRALSPPVSTLPLFAGIGELEPE